MAAAAALVLTVERWRRMLSPGMLQHLERYKYAGAGYTWLDYKLTPFWNWLVELLPMWMAPNLVTFIGFVGITGMAFGMCYAAPCLSGERDGVKGWIIAVHALTMFVYQHLDAVDGKQARRTGASSPLGQLFDHGCDTVVTMLSVLSTAICFDLGGDVRLAFLAMVTLVPFNFVQWAEYHKGACPSSNGFMGVTEGLCMMILMELTTAVAGPRLWCDMVLPVGSLLPKGLAVRDLFLVLYSATNFQFTLSLLWTVLRPCRADEPGLAADMQGDKDLGKVNALLQMVPFVAWVLLSWMWLYRVPDGVPLFDAQLSAVQHVTPSAFFERHTVLCCMLTGWQYVLITTRMMLAHMCKHPFSCSVNCAILTPLAVVTACSRLPALARPVFAHLCTEHTLTWVLCAVSFTMYLQYVVVVVRQICEHLGIQCFSIAYLEAAKAKKS